MTFHIGFIGDTHIGYRAGHKLTDEGVNIREQDGYDALGEIVDQLLLRKAGGKLDIVIHSGDLFHTSHPSIRSITWVQYQLRRLSKAEIPVYVLAGNHDASDERANIAAVAPINDTSRDIFALYKPAAMYKIEHPAAEGDIYLHAIAHHGLSANEAPEITPVDGAVNILTTHGAAVHPTNKVLLHCADSPREQIISPDILLNDDLNVRLLGHYHSRGQVIPGTHYAGSTIRRGWSDEPGKRGATIMGVEPDGRTEVVEYIDIAQRPQHDLDLIDATGLTGEDVQERILSQLARTTQDAEGRPIRPILRQRVTNLSPTVNQTVIRSALHKAASHGLTWRLDMKTLMETQEKGERESLSLENRHSFTGTGILKMYEDFAGTQGDALAQFSADEKKEIIERGEKYIKQANERTE